MYNSRIFKSLVFIFITIIVLGFRYYGFYHRYLVYDEFLDRSISADDSKSGYSSAYSSYGQVTGEGEIYYKYVKGEQIIYYVRNATLSSDKYKITRVSLILYPNVDAAPCRSRISFSGKLNMFKEAENEGSFDLKTHYRSMGFICAVKKADIYDVKPCSKFATDIMFSLRMRLKSFYKKALEGEEADIVGAIALGMKEDLSDEVQDIFSGAGLMHVMAISGLHISVVGMGIFAFLRKRGVGFLWSGITAVSMLALYGFLCGNKVSCIRAIGMFVIYIIAQILGEAYHMGRAILIMGIAQLYINPYIIHNSGFVFSYGAVLGIFFIASPLGVLYDTVSKNWMEDQVPVRGLSFLHEKPWWVVCRDKLAAAFVFSYATSLCTLWLVARFYYEIPTVSFLLNMLLLPLMPFLLGLALVGGFVGLRFPALGIWILKPCHYIVYLMEIVADNYRRLSMSSLIIGCPKLWQIIMYLLIIFFAVNFGRNIFKDRIRENFRTFSIRLLIMGSAVGILFIPARQKAEIDFLSVGQGDGIYISDGRGFNVMIDGGSTSNSSMGEYVLLPFLKYKGVATIDYWFVTHCDEDHISGLKYALVEGYKIKNVVMSEYVLRTDGFAEVVDLCKAGGVKVLYMNPGDKVISDKWAQLTLTCLGPTARSADAIGDDANARSLVLRLDYRRGKKEPVSAIFTGDMDGVGESLLISELSESLDGARQSADLGSTRQSVDLGSDRLLDVDILKVGHHGSKYSTSEEFLDAVSPEVAVISVGKSNSYGHPHRETLERLGNCSSRPEIFRTDEWGQVKVLLDKGGMAIKEFKIRGFINDRQ